MPRHFVIGLSATPWLQVLAELSPGTSWCYVTHLAELVPRHGDHVAGFFSLAEAALMQRFGLKVLTFSADGTVLPDAGRALRESRRLQLVLVPPVAPAPAYSAGFEAGPEALRRARAARARRAAAH